jgi:hypothetical protein
MGIICTDFYCNIKPDLKIKSDTTTSFKVVVKYDSSLVITKPRIITKYDSFMVQLPSSIDTQAVILAYFQPRIYSDTITDKNLSLFIFDSLFSNQIKSRQVSYKLLRPDSIIEKTVIVSQTLTPDPRNRIFAGASIQGGPQNSPRLLPSLIFQNKKLNQYLVSYDIFSNQIQLGYYFKIK